MALQTQEQVPGPGITDVRPPTGGSVPVRRRDRLRGAGRDRTALQAGVPRPSAARPPPAPPRRPQAGGTPGGVVRIPQRPTSGRPTGQARVPTSVPRRVPVPANITQLPTGLTTRENLQRRRSQLEQAGSFLEEAQRRRNRIRRK